MTYMEEGMTYKEILAELNSLPSGRVIQRLKRNSKIRMTIPKVHLRCSWCNTEYPKGSKMVMHETVGGRGNVIECIHCYSKKGCIGSVQKQSV